MKLLDMMGGGEELNPHQIAWANRDWKALEKLVDEYKEKPENLFFALLDSITYTKDKVEVNNVDYEKYTVDNMLSRHVDCIYSSYMMNMLGDSITDQMHYDYYFSTVTKSKRYNTSLKVNDDMLQKIVVKLLSKYYTISLDKAYMYRELLDNKGNLDKVLKAAKPMATEKFLKTFIKTKTEIGRAMKIVENF